MPAAIWPACAPAQSTGAIFFVTKGQKVWTSGAHFADWCFLLVRTDPDAPKHHGIRYLLVDMETPGIKVRPLVLLNGHRHFNEIFVEDVVVPKENLVRPLNHGWKVAITTLMFERSAQPVALAAEMGRRRAAGVRHDRRLRQNARSLRKPIGSYQGVKHPPDMLVALENAKSVTYYAVWAVDRGLDEVRLAVSMAKAAASDMFGKVAGTGIQLHGASA
jgi:alkylation response protein AidB-like acyl-CoA dehydrogenase